MAPTIYCCRRGDNIGASPLASALFHDEPTIDFLNAIGMNASAVGNHEFDEGYTELLRMQFGGCHPVDGCAVRPTFAGAKFPFLGANVSFTNGLPALLPFTVKVVRRRSDRRSSASRSRTCRRGHPGRGRRA